MKDILTLMELLKAGKKGGGSLKGRKGSILDDEKTSQAVKDFNKRTREKLGETIRADAVEKDDGVLVVYELPGVENKEAISLSLNKSGSKLKDYKIFMQVNWEESEAFSYTDDNNKIIADTIIKPTSSSQEHTLGIAPSKEIDIESVEAELKNGLLRVTLPFNEDSEDNQTWDIDIG